MQSLGTNHYDLTDFWLILYLSFSVCSSVRALSFLFFHCSSVEGLVHAKGPRASPDLAPELVARWPAAGKTKTEEQAALLLEKEAFGFMTLSLYVTQIMK